MIPPMIYKTDGYHAVYIFPTALKPEHTDMQLYICVSEDAGGLLHTQYLTKAQVECVQELIRQGCENASQ